MKTYFSLGIYLPFVLTIFFQLVTAQAPMQYQLISNISFPSLTATKVYSSDKLFLCYNQQLDIHHLNNGSLISSIDFSSISTGSTLNCFDSYQNNTYCLFSKGTIIIKYNVSGNNYTTFDNSAIKTKGKLALGGLISITNCPSTAKIYFYNHNTNVGVWQKPLTTAVTADYFLQVSPLGDKVMVFQGRRMFAYIYSVVLDSWTKVFNTTMLPLVGSNVFFLTFSLSGDIFYNTRGNQILQTRNSTDYSLIGQMTFTGLTVSNIQFTNNIGVQLSIHLYNATSNTSFIQLYNITSGQTSIQSISASQNTTFQSMKLYPTERVMVLNYDSFGCLIYQLTCPNGSIFVQSAGICLYCNQTNQCLLPTPNNTASNSSTPGNITSNSSTPGNITSNSSTPGNTTSNSSTPGNTTSNSSTSNNTTINNSTSNDTTSGDTSNQTFQTDQTQFQPSFSAFQQQAMTISGTFYSIPTIRQSLKSFSFLFLAIDSLWLYQYHNRTYGKNIKSMFQAVRKIEDMKFAFFSIINAAYSFVTAAQYKVQNITKYTAYTNPNYLAAQNKDGSFLQNTIDFMVYHIPGTLVCFLLFRWIFFRLFNFQISMFFRLYAFWGYFIICLIQPNIEYFCYLLGNQFYLSFYFNFLNKIFGAFWIICVFIIILLSCTSIFLLKYLYSKDVKLFMENTFRIGWGYTWVLLSLTIKRIFTGISHSYLYYYPHTQLVCLIVAQALQLLYMFFLFKKFNVFKEKLRVFARLFMNLIMITFQLSLLLTGYIDKQRSLKNIMDTQMYVIIAFLIINTLAFSVLTILSSIIQHFTAKKRQEAKKGKQNNNKTVEQCRKQTLKLKISTNKIIKSRPKLTYKLKSKFNIKSNVIIQTPDQDANKSIPNEKQIQSEYNYVQSIKESESRQPIKSKNLTSMKNLGFKQNQKSYDYKQPHSFVKSNVSIANECLNLDLQQKNKIFSCKKIKSVHRIPKSSTVFRNKTYKTLNPSRPIQLNTYQHSAVNLHASQQKTDKTLKHISSKKQTFDIVFSPLQQIQRKCKNGEQVIVEKNQENRISQDQP